MPNHFFEPDLQAILLRPWRWKLVTPFFPPEVKPVDDARHRRWRKTHSLRAPWLSVLLCLRGRTVQGFGDAVYSCGPSTVFFFDEHVRVDKGYPKWCPPVIHLWIIITHNEVLGCLHAVGKGRAKQILDTIFLFGPEEGRLLFRDLRAWSEATPPIQSQVIRCRLVASIALIVSHMVALGYETPIPRDRLALQRQRVDLARRYILHAEGRGMRLDQLAQLAGYSKYHFLRLFRRHTGESLQAYLNATRLRRVQELQKQGRLMKEIAAEIGFSSPSNFARWFRRFRLPPREEAAASSVRPLRLVKDAPVGTTT